MLVNLFYFQIFHMIFMISKLHLLFCILVNRCTTIRKKKIIATMFLVYQVMKVYHSQFNI